MPNDQYSALLGDLDLFAGLTEHHLQLLAERVRSIPCNVGDDIMNEGQIGYSLYVIAEGDVRVYLPTDAGDAKRFSEVELAKMTSGDIFGEYSFVDELPVSASVQATSETLLLQLLHEDLREVLGQNTDMAAIVYKNLLKLLISRLRADDTELDVFAASWT